MKVPRTAPTYFLSAQGLRRAGLFLALISGMATGMAQPAKSQQADGDQSLIEQAKSIQNEFAQGSSASHVSKSSAKHLTQLADQIAKTALKKQPAETAQKLAAIQQYLSLLPTKQRKQVQEQAQKLESLKSVAGSVEGNGNAAAAQKTAKDEKTTPQSAASPSQKEASRKLAERLQPQTDLGASAASDSKTFKNWFDTNKQQLALP